MLSEATWLQTDRNVPRLSGAATLVALQPCRQLLSRLGSPPQRANLSCPPRVPSGDTGPLGEPQEAGPGSPGGRESPSRAHRPKLCSGAPRPGSISPLPLPAPRRSHLAPLFDNPKLDKELRAMLREKFPEFCSSPSPPIEGRSRVGGGAGLRRGLSWQQSPPVGAGLWARRALGAGGRGRPSLRMDTTHLGRLVPSLRAN